MSEVDIKPRGVTPIRQRYCCYTHIHSNTPSSEEQRRLTKWARDYRRDRFSVWTSDEANVNSLHGEVGEGPGDAWIERSEH